MSTEGWEPAEQVAKNAEGAHQALIGGAWTPVEKAAKNAEGKFMVFRGGSAAPAPAAAKPPNSLAQAAEEQPGTVNVAGFDTGIPSNPALVQVGSAMMAIPEAIQEGYMHATGRGEEARNLVKGRKEAMTELGTEHPLSRPVGTLTDVATGGVLPAVKAAGAVKSGLATGGIYGGLNPTGGGDNFLLEKAKQITGGALTGATISKGVEMLSKAPAAVRSWFDNIISPSAGQFGGATKPAAADTAKELQRQRDISEGKKGTPTGQSEYERTKTDFEQRMVPVKYAAFNTGAKIDTASAASVIDDLMLKNPDKQVQAALREVKQTIERATKGSATASLPAAGARMDAAQLKAMQGQSGQLDMGMADEVRQSINRLINQSGDKALSGHTKDILGQVRDRMLKDAPKEYKDWIAQHAQGSEELARFAPEVSVLGKTTTSQRGAVPLAGQDAQHSLETVFKGGTANRDLKQLVDATRHEPNAIAGLHDSYSKWMLPADQAGKVNVTQAAARWNQTKEAVRDAGMFTPEHYAAIDKVMTKLHTAEKGGEAAKAAGAGVAWVLGLPFGRPGSTAMVARTAIGRMSGGEKTPEQVGQMISKLVQNPAAAAAAAAPATPANVEEFARFMSVVGPREATKQEPPRQRRVPNALGMRPGGI